jgi:3-oxoacyl-[acyl-carrier-protein] synthase-3
VNLSGKILGVGSYVPRQLITNAALAETCAGVDPGWTERVLGIKERRIATYRDTTGEMALAAGKKALKAAGLHHSDLSLLIVATTTPDYPAPSMASYVQARLGSVPRYYPAFDVNAVCAGFMTALIMAYQLLPHYEHILVIGADAFSRITDWSQRDCVFFGDGAGAVVVTRDATLRPFDKLRTQQAQDATKGMAGHVLNGYTDHKGAFMVCDGTWRMNGKAVFEAAMGHLSFAIDIALTQSGLKVADIDHIIPHQASLNLLQAVADEAGLPFEKFRLTLDRYANTAAASIPLTLDHHKEAITEGDKVLFFGIGAGWQWGAAVVQW